MTETTIQVIKIIISTACTLFIWLHPIWTRITQILVNISFTTSIYKLMFQHTNQPSWGLELFLLTLFIIFVLPIPILLLTCITCSLLLNNTGSCIGDFQEQRERELLLKTQSNENVLECSNAIRQSKLLKSQIRLYFARATKCIICLCFQKSLQRQYSRHTNKEPK